MRVFLAMEETPFYQPGFVADFLRQTGDDIVGAILVTKVGPKGDIERYMKKHMYYLKPSEIVKLALQEPLMRLRKLLRAGEAATKFPSVRSVYREFGIDFFEVQKNINTPECLERIATSQPDVIISSQSLFFKDEILKLPAKTCLNRHAALLPAYGGLLPVFQAYCHGEQETGVSIHTMERAIDAGIVLAQRRIAFQEGETLADVYEKSFAESAGILIEALDKVRNDDYAPAGLETEPSYYSFPTREDWAAFRERGGRFI